MNLSLVLLENEYLSCQTLITDIENKINNVKA